MIKLKNILKEEKNETIEFNIHGKLTYYINDDSWYLEPILDGETLAIGGGDAYLLPNDLVENMSLKDLVEDKIQNYSLDGKKKLNKILENYKILYSTKDNKTIESYSDNLVDWFKEQNYMNIKNIKIWLNGKKLNMNNINKQIKGFQKDDFFIKIISTKLK